MCGFSSVISRHRHEAIGSTVMGYLYQVNMNTKKCPVVSDPKQVINVSWSDIREQLIDGCEWSPTVGLNVSSSTGGQRNSDTASSFDLWWALVEF